MKYYTCFHVSELQVLVDSVLQWKQGHDESLQFLVALAEVHRKLRLREKQIAIRDDRLELKEAEIALLQQAVAEYKEAIARAEKKRKSPWRKIARWGERAGMFLLGVFVGRGTSVNP